MKFTIKKSELLDALNIVGKCINSQNVLPILGCFRFEISAGRLNITGGNMEIFISQTISLEADGECDIAISAPRLLGLVKELKEQPLSFQIIISPRNEKERSIIDYSVVLSTANGTYNMPAFPGDDYPDFSVAADIEFEMASDVLFGGLDKTLYAVEEDVTKSIGGLNISAKGSEVSFIGTTGHVGGLYSFAQEKSFGTDISCTVLPKALVALRNITPDDTIKVAIGKNNLVFRPTENTVVKTVLIDSKYPDLKKLIPTKVVNLLTVSRSELIGALKRVRQFAPSLTNTARFEIDGMQCRISAVNDSGEKAEETLFVDYQGSHIVVGFNANLILSALGAITADTVYISLPAFNKMAVIKENADEMESADNCMIVMPLVLPEHQDKLEAS